MFSGDPPYVLQYNQPGGFPGTQPPPNQQNNYKQGSVQNSPPFKPQQQPPPPPVQPPLQQVATRNLQGKPQPLQQQQLQQPNKPPITNTLQTQLQPQPQAQSNPTQSQPQSQLQPQPQSQSQSRVHMQCQPSPQRLKPILKQPSHTQQQGGVVEQHNPNSSSQPSVATSTPSTIANSNTTSLISNEASNESQVPETIDVDMQDLHPRWKRKAPGCKCLKYFVN